MFRDLRADLVLPRIALVDGLVQALALSLTLEATYPDVEILVLLADKTAGDDHSLGDLEGYDDLLHVLHPVAPLSGFGAILSKLEKHD